MSKIPISEADLHASVDGALPAARSGEVEEYPAALGYELIGGRLLPGSSGPVAQFMYHDASGQRLTFYVTTEMPANRDTGFRFTQEGPVNVFYWIDGQFGYALSAGIGKTELARIATAVFDQLEHK